MGSFSVEFLLIPLFVVLAVVGAIYGYRWEKKHREALAAWALAGGWEWNPAKGSPPSLPLDLFQLGHSRWSRFHASRRFEGLTPGLESAHFRLFEYHYAITIRSGKHTHTQHFHFNCAMIDAGADLGQVQIRDETIGDKLVQAIGFDDIDLEDPQFSSKFVVRAKDRRDAYELLEAAMMQYLSQHRGWSITTIGRILFICRSARVSPEQFESIVRFGSGFLAQIPRVIVNRERAQRGLPPIIGAGAASESSRFERASNSTS